MEISRRMSIVIPIIVGILLLAGIVMTSLLKGRQSSKKVVEVSNFHNELLGENVFIFSPDDNPEEVTRVIGDIYNKQEANQFGDERYALLFMPGEYDESIKAEVGFYTQVAGLGLLPTDTSIERLECLARWLGNNPDNHNACQNFWRSAENIHMRSNSTWAVSQATDLRRIQVDGALFLHDNHGWCSGGYMADSYITKMVDSGTQQQWLSRNCDWNVWMDQNWNMVFVGLEDGAAPRGVWPANAYTNIQMTNMKREKPFLIYDKEKGYGVYLPAVENESKGTTWQKGVSPVFLEKEEAINPLVDCILPIERFYIARPGDDAATINAELEKGKHLLLTPGVYKLNEAIRINNANTVCLGLGLATLRNMTDKPAIEIADRSGIFVAGLLVDAGTENAEYLVRVDGEDADKDYPICLSDMYFRIGGANSAKSACVKTALIIDADDVIGDNFWIWRADHGAQIGWDKNRSDTGIIVNGDNVVTYALMVEHFEKYQTIWNGNNGRLYMYQSEIPYDVPNQESWKSHDGAINGYSSVKVADDVTNFEAYGLGIYLYNRDAQVILHSAMEVPDHDGVIVQNICTVMITGNPGMERVINESGGSVGYPGAREVILKYENGKYK